MVRHRATPTRGLEGGFFWASDGEEQSANSYDTVS